MFFLENPMYVLGIGIGMFLIAYGIYTSQKAKLKKQVNDDTQSSIEEEEVTEDIEMKEMDLNDRPDLFEKIDRFKKIRYAKLDVWSGLNFGFGFGIGIFLAGIAIFFLSIIFFGATVTALFPALHY